MMEHFRGRTVPYFQGIIACHSNWTAGGLSTELPPAATFGRGRLRDPDVLLPLKREKSHGPGRHSQFFTVS